MKRFFIKSVACISIAFFLAVVLPSGFNYVKVNAATKTPQENAALLRTGSCDSFGGRTMPGSDCYSAQRDQEALSIVSQNAAADWKKVYELESQKLKATSELQAKAYQDQIDQIKKTAQIGEDAVKNYSGSAKLINDISTVKWYGSNNAAIDTYLAEYEKVKDTDPTKAAEYLANVERLKSSVELRKQQDIELAKDIENLNTCGALDIGCNWKWLFSKVLWPGLQGKTVEVVNMILTLVSNWLAVILGLCAGVLDATISFTMQIGKQTVLLDTLKQVWVILRDTFNIFFIFILLYIAIQTIIKGSAVKTKQMLANVVIAALLINFSLMITNVVIDTSNIFANALYSQTQGGDKVTISTQMMQSLKLQSMSTQPLPKASSGLFARTMIQIVLYSVTIWALIQGIVLMLTRTIVFLILMALSPIGFMGEIIPKIDEQSKKWRSALLDQALVGPVFIFFLLLITKLINGGLMGTIDTVSKATSGQQLGGATAVILNVCIIVGFFITAVKITKKLSGDAGAFLSNAASGLAGALTVGAGGMLLRNTVGRGAAALLKNNMVQAVAARVPGGGLALKGINNVAKSSFDVRNSTLGKTLEKQGLNLGKAGGTGGFQGQVDRAQKSMIATGKSLDADMGSSRSRALVKEKVVENQNKIITDSVETKGNVEKEIQELKNKYQAKSQELKENLPPEAKKAAAKEQQQISDKILQKEKEMVENEKKRQAAEKKLQAIANGEAVSEKDLADDEVKAIQSRHQNAYADSQEAKGRKIFKGRGSVVGVAMSGFIGHRANVKALRKSFKGKSANDLLVEQMKKEKEAEDAKKAPTKEAKP